MAADSNQRGIGSFVGAIKDSINDNFALDIDGIKQAGGDCNVAARETSAMCISTKTKAGQLVDLGIEMKSVLDGFGDGIDANDFAAGGKLISSDKIQTALNLASEMDDLALACVKQSVKMIDAIDAGIETLPDIIEKSVDKRMENAKQQGGKEGDPEIPDLKSDIWELEQATKAVQDSNPLTATDSLQKAFDGITAKGQLCGQTFETILNFSEDVAGVSEAIKDLKLGKLAAHVHDLVKDIWRCLRLSDLIRSFAVEVERLIKWIVQLIQAVIASIDFDIFGCGCCADVESIMKSSGMDIGDLKVFSQKS